MRSKLLFRADKFNSLLLYSELFLVQSKSIQVIVKMQHHEFERVQSAEKKKIVKEHTRLKNARKPSIPTSINPIAQAKPSFKFISIRIRIPFDRIA